MHYLNKTQIIKPLTILSFITFILSSCYKEEDYNYSANDIFEELEIKISDSIIYADGASKSIINYRFPIEYDTNYTKLNIKASNGTFLESGTNILHTNFTKLDTLEEFRLAKATLVASTSPGKCIITTELLNYQKESTIQYNIAYPTGVSLSSDLYYITNDTISEVTLNASLSSTNGVASKGRVIMFDFSPNIGFLSSKQSYSNASGTASTKYLFNNTTGYTGDIIFTAKAIGENGDSLSSLYTVKVINH